MARSKSCCEKDPSEQWGTPGERMFGDSRFSGFAFVFFRLGRLGWTWLRLVEFLKDSVGERCRERELGGGEEGASV